jgi:hypothetical protein
MIAMITGGQRAFVPHFQDPTAVPMDFESKPEIASLSHIIQIDSLNDEGLVVKKPIEVELTSDGDQIIAAFREAEIVSSGDFAVEAIDWLKDMIASAFRLYEAERQALGPLPKRQLAILENYLGQKQNRKRRCP